MLKGVTGRYVIVDLSSGSTRTQTPSEDFYQKYIGGYGLGAAIITARQKAGIDPLAPEAYLGFCTGLLTDSGAPFSGRFMLVAKSPLTGGWGDANCGGHLSSEIKRAGYDAVFFTGRADKPVWVFISDQGIEINDAGALWGCDVVEAEKKIKAELGDTKVRVATIGEAGERCSLISGVVTEGGRIAARSGLGAVMGSKNLKAVAFRGRGKIEVAQADRIKKLSRAFRAEFNDTPRLFDRITVRFINFFSKMISKTGIHLPAEPGTVRLIFKHWGTCGLTVYSALTGDMPIKNWGGSGYVDYSFGMAAQVSGDAVVKHQQRKYACQSCPLGCGGIIDIRQGRYAGTTGHKPEYETLAAFGGLLMNDDLATIVELNEMCNRAGIDTISTGGILAFAMECFANGIISRDDLDGLDLSWGKGRAMVKLTEMIIKRRGIGDLLADGVRVAARKLGPAAEQYAMHAGGQELPMHDSRLDHGFALAYQCEPTPGRHTIASYLDADLRSGKKMFPEIQQMIKQARGKTAKKVARYTATGIYAQLINCCGLCILGVDSMEYPLLDFIAAATGWDLTPQDYFRAGQRISALRKAFNVREGLRRADSKLHQRALGHPPQSKGPVKGRRVDIEALEKMHYGLLGYDPVTGGPTPQTLARLSLNHLFDGQEIA